MHRYSMTQMKKLVLIGAACLLLVAAVVAGLVFAALFKPEIYEKQAVDGAPQGLPESYGYVAYETDGVCKVLLACTPAFDGKYASINLTNPEENGVLLKAELYSVKVVQTSDGKADFAPDKKLGETGFLRPGTYVETVKLSGLTAGEENRVLVKIATMNEENRTSNGFFYIRTTIS
ncbi:MAG TPA: hypothetical protein DDW30_07695 [Clostridiales bacterium]|nr:hypothetical protein [Clostridiales bacterium]